MGLIDIESSETPVISARTGTLLGGKKQARFGVSIVSSNLTCGAIPDGVFVTTYQIVRFVAQESFEDKICKLLKGISFVLGNLI